MSCSTLFELVEQELDEPLGRIVELDFWEHRLLIELQVGTKANRKETNVSFKPALMAVCVLYLSSSCLPYELQRRRFDDMMRQHEETAQRLIASRMMMWLYSREDRIPKELVLGNRDKDGQVIDDEEKVVRPLDTPAKVQAYRNAIKMFGNFAYVLIVRNNKVMKKSGSDVLQKKGIKAGKIKMSIVKRAGELKVTVKECAQLRNADGNFGRNDVYVIVNVNGETRRTSTVNGAGENPQWNVVQDVQPKDQLESGNQTFKLNPWPSVKPHMIPLGVTLDYKVDEIKVRAHSRNY